MATKTTLTALNICLLLGGMSFSSPTIAESVADDSVPQSKSNVEKDGTSDEPSRSHIVGVKPLTSGAEPETSSEVDSGNAPSMGFGIQFDFSRPKSEVKPDPNPSEMPVPLFTPSSGINPDK